MHFLLGSRYLILFECLLRTLKFILCPFTFLIYFLIKLMKFLKEVFSFFCRIFAVNCSLSKLMVGSSSYIIDIIGNWWYSWRRILSVATIITIMKLHPHDLFLSHTREILTCTSWRGSECYFIVAVTNLIIYRYTLSVHWSLEYMLPIFCLYLSQQLIVLSLMVMSIACSKHVVPC